MRRSKFTGGLTEFSANGGKRRGPRTALTDEQLHTIRDQFVQIFEGEWAEIGWNLQRCKKPEDLIQIFSPLAESRSWIAEPIAIFCRRSSELPSRVTLRKVRGERRDLVEPKSESEEDMRRAIEQLHQVDWALTQAKGDSRRIVKQARKQRRKVAWKIKLQDRKLANAERSLKTRLQSLEASFARQELFRFLKSNRYELTPPNLANAVAGLPHMGWRQSMRRCKKKPSHLVNGQRIQTFKSIRYLAAGARKKSENVLVRDFRESVIFLPSRYVVPRNELADNWFYLERAIRQAYRAKANPKSLPFVITKLYFEQLHSQSQVDMVLAQHAKITLPKPKTRSSSPRQI
jgi:hypothetical protein